ncbi:MAG: hypothetical protein HY958_07755 [Bacteroidia bacterium]|nr:hypothetical protein [Bacteroidia bacterium]
MKGFILLILIFLSIRIFSQEKTDTTAGLRNDAVKVFMDCNFCDINYIRQNITFVNYVRDRKEADVHILITEQGTGSGGNEFTIDCMGRQKFNGMNDTLKFSTDANTTEDEQRIKMVAKLKLCLMRYVAKTPLADKIDISYALQDSGAIDVADKWKNWVFNINLGGYFNGEETYATTSVWGSLSASKITPDWKILFSIFDNYNEKFYIIGDTAHYTSLNESRSLNHLTVKSLGEHWSAGGGFNIITSTYNNYKLKVAIAPALEYDLFKYSESTRKQLRFLYSLGTSYNWYNDTTIYQKTQEYLYYESLKIAFQYIEKWGSVTFSVSGSNYLHDFTKNSLDLYSSFSIRLFKGLSLSFSGGISFVHDQISLSNKDASSEDILLRQRQFATNYSYWGNVNLNYTFGSIYNNVVNPRFGDDQ